MKDDEFDRETIRQMLDWLSRGMDEDGNFPEAAPVAEMMLTEEDYAFLREHRIAVF